MKAKDLRNSILQLAIQGKLVPQDPADEPACKLLEKIKEEREKLIKDGIIKKEKEVLKIKDDEKPFEIPDSWEWVRLGNIINLTSGRDLMPDCYSVLQISNSVPYITGASNIENEQIIINRWTVKPQTFAYKGDLLLTCKGTVGLIAFLQCEKAHIARQIMSLKVFSYINRTYIKYFISSYITELQKKAKSMIPGISRDDILQILVPLPPLAEQQRIIDKIEKLEPYIKEYEEYETRLTKLDTDFPKYIKKSILQYAIQGKVVPQNPNDEPASKLLKQIEIEKQMLIANGVIKKEKPLKPITEDEKLFEIPESWELVRLNKVVELINGIKAYNKTLPLLDAKYLRTRTYHKIADSGVIVKKNEYLILVDGENSGEVFEVFCEGIMGSTFKKLFISKFVNQKYILKFLNFYQDLFRQNKKGSAIPHLNKDIFMELLLPLPPLEEQQRIVDKIEHMFKIIDSK